MLAGGTFFNRPKSASRSARVVHFNSADYTHGRSRKTAISEGTGWNRCGRGDAALHCRRMESGHLHYGGKLWVDWTTATNSGRKLGRCLAEVKSPPGRLLGAWDIAPDLERILGEALFGTIWRRPALTPVQREIHPFVPHSHEPRRTAEASPGQCAEHGIDSRPGRGVDHSGHLIQWSAGRNPGAGAVQTGL